MKIGILSDTHGSLLYFEKALALFGKCNYIIHGGDVLYHGPSNDLPEDYHPKVLAEKINQIDNIIFAKGNCDSDADQMVIRHPIQSPFVLLQLGKIKLFLSHGYQKEKAEYIEMAQKFEANLYIYGHSHVKELYQDKNLTVCNPGSTAIPKDGSHSVAILEDETIKLIDLNTHQVLQELTL